MTLLEFTNKFLCQLFFFRITKWVKEGKILRWGVIYFILPFTGWNRGYIVLGKMRHIIFYNCKNK